MEESDPNQLQPGQPLGGGRFVLIRPLGQGGMGLVWLARDEQLGQEVALKFMPAEIRGDEVALDDMRREVLKSRQLGHPNIIRTFDWHEVPGEPGFISMEYVDGPTLNRLRLDQPYRVFRWHYIKDHMQRLCDAVEYAHSEGIVHRDIKPANLMIDSRDRIKLADFGIAAAIMESASRLTHGGAMSGTPAYMSPQQLDGELPRPTDDIYALGATLYEVLTSKPPFIHGDIPHQIRNVPARPLDQQIAELGIENDVPDDVASMIMACLSKVPEKRPQSAHQMAEWIGIEIRQRLQIASSNEPASGGHLEELVDFEAVGVEATEDNVADEAMDAYRLKKPLRRFAAAICALFVLGGVAGILLFRNSGRPGDGGVAGGGSDRGAGTGTEGSAMPARDSQPQAAEAGPGETDDSAPVRLRSAAAFARKRGAPFGIPDFHENRNRQGRVFGMRSIPDGYARRFEVPREQLGELWAPFKTSPDSMPDRFRAAHNWAIHMGFVSGYPDYVDHGDNVGVVCLLPGRARLVEVDPRELGPMPDTWNILIKVRDWMFENNHAGYPTFHARKMRFSSRSKVEIAVIPIEVARKHDIPERKLLLADQMPDIPATPLSEAHAVIGAGLDETFHAALEPIGGNRRKAVVESVAVQADGKIVVGGHFQAAGRPGRPYLARLNSDGSLDASFDPGTGPDDVVRVVFVQEDGKILVSGLFKTFDGKVRNHVARLHPDGSLDEGFDHGERPLYAARGFHQQPDERIVAGLIVADRGQIQRWLPDGTPDESFLMHDHGVHVRAVGLQADGRVVHGGGYESNPPVLGRVNPDGSNDTTFTPGAPDEPVLSVACQPGGGIIAAGSFKRIGTDKCNYIARFEPNGTLDRGFGSTDNVVREVRIHPDGRILVCGNFRRFGDRKADYFIVLQPDGTPDPSVPTWRTFDGQCFTATGQPDGRILVGGRIWSFAGKPVQLLARLMSPARQATAE